MSMARKMHVVVAILLCASTAWALRDQADLEDSVAGGMRADLNRSWFEADAIEDKYDDDNEESYGTPLDDSGRYFAILEVHRLGYTYFRHTEIKLCDSSKLPSSVVSEMKELLLHPKKKGFVKIPPETWQNWDGRCATFWFGGSDSTADCSGVTESNDMLRANSSPTADFTAEGTAIKYLYGTTNVNPGELISRMCCLSDSKKRFKIYRSNAEDEEPGLWSGESYGELTNNCNTFTMKSLKCVLGLSYALPSWIRFSHGGKFVNPDCHSCKDE